MRHTNITLQIAGGIPITTVAVRAGHVNANTTSKIYAHAIKSADEAALQYLENILQPKTGEKQKKEYFIIIRCTTNISSKAQVMRSYRQLSTPA